MTDPLRTAAQRLVDWWDDPKIGGERFPMGEAIEALREALASPAPSTSRDDARDAALEEAARVADQYATPPTDDSDYQRGWVRGAECVANKVRSLKGQPPPAAPADQSKETP